MSLPHSRNAELSVIGSIILDPGCVNHVLDIVSSNDFSVKDHVTLMKSIEWIRGNGDDIDIVTVSNAAEGYSKGVHDEGYFRRLLLDIVDSTVSSANVAEHAKIVRSRSIQRRLIDEGNNIINDAKIPTPDVSILLSASQQRIQDLEDMLITDYMSSEDHCREAVDRLINGSGSVGLSTGFPHVDKKIAALLPNYLYVIAARPSMGKTSFAMNIMENVAAYGHPVLFLSLEMDSTTVWENMICSVAKVDSQKARMSMLTEQEMERLMASAGEVSKYPITMVDKPGMSIHEVRGKCRRYVQTEGVKLIVVDYLQLIRCPGQSSKVYEIAEVSRGLKDISRELKVPVVALAQLNRSVDSREDHRPKMSDLRESGAIEQDADLVGFLYRPEYYDPGDLSLKGKAELIISKQRNGPTGTVEMTFSPKFMRFSDKKVSTHYEEVIKT